jgi:hypothetical protein
MHSGAAFAMGGREVARKNGCRVLISAAKPHDFKVLLKQIWLGRTVAGIWAEGEERL